MKQISALIIFALMIGSATLSHGGTLKGKIDVSGKVNPENVVVYVEGIKGDFKAPSKRPQMNHVNLQFKPLILPILKGTTVDFPNSDPVFHSGFSISAANPFDLGLYGQGMEKFVHFGNSGTDELFCHIHSHMHAYVLSLDNPYFASVNKDGSYTITDIPEGSYNVTAWLNPNNISKKSAKIPDGDQSAELNFTIAEK